MIRLKIAIVSILLISSFSCKKDKKTVEEISEVGVSTFYLIRHAEKDRSDPDNSDPELNQDGMGRAMHWAEILKDVPLDVIYSTDYLRTSMTARATSTHQDIDIQYYDPRILDINEFKSLNLNKTALVVGHSNTTPDLVNKLLGEERYEAMDDTDNGSLFIVQIVNGNATSQRLHFSCNCPKR